MIGITEREELLVRLVEEKYATNMTSAANLYEQLMKKLKEKGYTFEFGHPIAEEAWDLFLKHGVFEDLELVDAVTVDISSDNLNLIEDPLYAFDWWKKRNDWKLSIEMIAIVQSIAVKLGIPLDLLRFNKFKEGTCYIGMMDGPIDFINIVGDIVTDSDSNCPLKSIEAILAHEFYGHRQNSNEACKPNKWRDECNASYKAFHLTKNLLSKAHRLELLDDAIFKATYYDSELLEKDYAPSDFLRFKAEEDEERAQLIKKLESERRMWLE